MGYFVEMDEAGMPIFKAKTSSYVEEAPVTKPVAEETTQPQTEVATAS
jgi:hypothetical protein